jgi:hypothetical protein
MNRRAAAPIAAVLLLAALAAALPAGAQTVRGTVVDAATEAPVAGAVVTVLEGNRRVGRVRTADDGSFEIALRRAATVVVHGERLGYRAAASEPVEVALRETVELRLPLSEGTVALQPVTVTGRRQPPRVARLENGGFYERQRSGFGRFLTREDIERQPNLDLPQILDRLPGTTLVTARNASIILFARGSHEGTLGRMSGSTAGQPRALNLPANMCPPLLYMDGVRVEYPPSGLLGIVEPERIEAIETYTGPSQTPPEFGGTNASCGVIVIWTRNGS